MSADTVQLVERWDDDLDIAGSSALYVTNFLPTMFACLHQQLVWDKIRICKLFKYARALHSSVKWNRSTLTESSIYCKYTIILSDYTESSSIKIYCKYTIILSEKNTPSFDENCE